MSTVSRASSRYRWPGWIIADVYKSSRWVIRIGKLCLSVPAADFMVLIAINIAWIFPSFNYSRHRSFSEPVIADDIELENKRMAYNYFILEKLFSLRILSSLFSQVFSPSSSIFLKNLQRETFNFFIEKIPFCFVLLSSRQEDWHFIDRIINNVIKSCESIIDSMRLIRRFKDRANVI